ncbi:iron complex transport system ATP-binding protein [Limimonas halophila]|uniref:Iron complex transport system ATP-binding protein n=1 Tax=Limimonas halophila TaxID=1082479 RepID=A0A1G7PRL7_9PROT|nr:ABC transporter ATP-binding protein [Limimonas halophila]SDF88864.1 iron complex transport system ATP-binding protein [Limimonas halophila]
MASRETDETGTGLHAAGITVVRGGRPILRDVDVRLATGGVMAVCGANGSGKSTLLAALAGLVPVAAGSVSVDGEAIHRLRRREVARRIAVLTQGAPAAEGFSVRELVHLGRHPWRGPLQPAGREDRRAVEWALDVTGTAALAERDVITLSGGERQRAHLAMALAQGCSYLLLDEPTTYLDPRHQLDILHLVRELNRTHGLSVLWVLHDLNQAAHYSDRVVVLAEGRVQADGPPAEALHPDHVAAAFNLRVLRLPHPETGQPLCVPSAEQDAPLRPDAP